VELKHFREENESLRQLLEKKDAEIDELRQAKPAAVEDLPAVEDVDSYEAELIQFRRQLETDRARLNDEIQVIRQRNEELEETTRDIEMQLSKERADLARERTRLDRIRAELQAEIDRLQKDGGLSNRLAPVQRLRDEIAERKAGSSGASLRR
jgi:chromosome segregation ATPase